MIILHPLRNTFNMKNMFGATSEFSDLVAIIFHKLFKANRARFCDFFFGGVEGIASGFKILKDLCVR